MADPWWCETHELISTSEKYCVVGSVVPDADCAMLPFRQFRDAEGRLLGLLVDRGAVLPLGKETT